MTRIGGRKNYVAVTVWLDISPRLLGGRRNKVTSDPIRWIMVQKIGYWQSTKGFHRSAVEAKTQTSLAITLNDSTWHEGLY